MANTCLGEPFIFLGETLFFSSSRTGGFLGNCMEVEEEEDDLTADIVSQRTGLSHYLLTVLYDFFSHTLAQHIHASASEEEEVEKALRKKRRHQFAQIVCHNEQIHRGLNNHEIKLELVKLDHMHRTPLGRQLCEQSLG